ncbi:hypothetical protein L195_g044813, partial [Trifolium pratense]
SGSLMIYWEKRGEKAILDAAAFDGDGVLSGDWRQWPWEEDGRVTPEGTSI